MEENIILFKSEIMINVDVLASIIDDSACTCDEIIEEAKTIPTNFMNFTLVITTVLLIAASIYCYLIKY